MSSTTTVTLTTTTTVSPTTTVVATVLQLPDPLGQLELALNCAALLSHLITAGCIGALLCALRWRTPLLRITKVSGALQLFFCAHLAFAVCGVPYQFYRIAWWRPAGTYTTNIYSPNLLFWLSASELVGYGAMPCAVFSLAVQRLLVLKVPLASLWGQRKSAIDLAGALLFVGILCTNLIGHLAELPLDTVNVIFCETASCTTTRHRLIVQLWSKIVFSCANVVACLLFLQQLRGTENAKKLNNRVVVFTLFVELIAGVVPCFTSMLLNQLGVTIGAPNSGLKGELGIFCAALDAAACAVLYALMLFKRPGRKNATVGAGDGGAGIMPSMAVIQVIPSTIKH